MRLIASEFVTVGMPKILVAEDDASLARHYVTLLREWNCKKINLQRQGPSQNVFQSHASRKTSAYLQYTSSSKTYFC